MGHIFPTSPSLPPLDVSALNTVQTSPPFVIHIEHLDNKNNVSWRPAAFIKIMPALRESGFLRDIPPEELKSLLFLLTFLTPNGDCWPLVVQLAEAMGVSTGKARERMERLSDWRWQNKKMVVAARHGNGAEAFALAPGVIPVTEDAAEPQSIAPPQTPTASREAVIAYSRARYTRPRAVVEREIAELNDWDLPDDALLDDDLPDAAEFAADGNLPLPPDEDTGDDNPPVNAADFALTTPTTEAGETVPSVRQNESARQRKLSRQLARVGLNPEEIQLLLEQFEPGRIRRQLLWLPYRHARNPSAFLLAAIEKNYAPPPLLRRRDSESAVGPLITAEEAEQPPPSNESALSQ